MRAQDIPPHLHDRYGIRPPSRWRWVGVALALAVAVPVVVYSASRYVATQGVPYALISWSASDTTHVRVLWKLDAAPHAQWCAIRAQDFDRFDVGYVVVPVAAGATSMQYTMTTTERPLAVDVVSCAFDPYALPGPQFPPGRMPVRQVAPGLTPGVYAPSTLAALH